MREIKYRGIDAGYYPEKIVWREGSLVVCDNGDCVIETGRKGYGYSGYGSNVIPETVGQYIGKSDRKDIKLFEGDKVDAYLSEMVYFTGIIVFKNGIFCISQGGKRFGISVCEKVGTIHDKGGE